jgi:hypothetical protein
MKKETKLKTIKVFSYVFLAFAFVAGIYFYSQIDKNGPSAEIAKAFTEKNDYSESEELKVEIINNESETICFSSCYPYVMQAKHNSWDLYSYPQCEEDNIAETCIPPNQLKAFAISLNGMFLEPTMHRLAIPACVGCAVGEQFRVDKIIYSNEFEIK